MRKPIKEDYSHLLTPEQLDQAQAGVGRWNITTVGAEDGRMAWRSSIIQQADALEKEDIKIYFSASTPNILGQMAYIVEGDEVLALVPFSAPDQLARSGYSLLDTFFPFEELKEIDAAMTEEFIAKSMGKENVDGGISTVVSLLDFKNETKSNPVVLVICVVLALSAFGLYYFKNKKNSAS